MNIEEAEAEAEDFLDDFEFVTDLNSDPNIYKLFKSMETAYREQNYDMYENPANRARNNNIERT